MSILKWVFPKKRKSKHLLNRKKDKRDSRDKLYHAHFRAQPQQPLPSKVDLMSNVPVILNQLDIGSCTAHGLAGNLHFLQVQELKAKQLNQPQEYGTHFTPVSRMMIYAGERMIEGTLSSDDGAQIRDGVKYLANFGVCAESIWPYNKSLLHRQPSKAAIAAAATHKISSYYRLTSLDDMKHCLAAGFPFVFGSYLVESFESEQVAKTGIVPDPQPGDQEIGGHCMYVIGYDDEKQAFHVVNSWGKEWGDNGTCWMSYHYLSNPNLTDDIWTIRK
jgi:C1A family cysteine protease